MPAFLILDMYSSIQNLFAATTFVILAMTSCEQCMGQQAWGSSNLRQSDGRLSVQSSSAQPPTADRPGNDLLSDLRSNRRATSEENLRAERPRSPLQYEPTSLTTDSLSTPSQTVSNQSAVGQAQTFFRGDQPPPVVVVWLNSDLQTPLLSKGQLKQLMRTIPDRDLRTQQFNGNTRQTNSQSSVRLASFDEAVSEETTPDEPVAETTLGVETSQEQITTFNKRLMDIRDRHASKTKQIANDESADSTIKSELNNLLGLANEWIERAASDLKEFESETAKKVAFKTNLTKRELELAEEREKARSNFSPKPDFLPSALSEKIENLQKDLSNQEADLRSSMDALDKVRKEISVRDRRVTELPSLKRKNAKEEDETKGKLEELKNQPDGLNRALQKLWLDAKFLSLEITEKSLELESNRKEQTARILPLELEELTLRIRRYKTRLAETRGRSDMLRDQQLDERRVAARDALNKTLTQSTPQLKELAEFNFDLVTQKKSMAVKSDELEKELINVRQMKKKLDESQERIEDQIETLGPTASGIRLVEHRRSLISTGKSQSRLLELADRLQHKQARKLLVKERKDQLVLGDSFKLEVLANVEDQVEDHVQRQTAVDVANQLMETEKEYATDLINMFEDNIDKLSQLESAHKALIDAVHKARAFSDKNALWVRSAKPIEINDFSLCQAGLQSIVTSDQWQEIGNHACQTFQKRPYDVGLFAMVIGSLLVVRRRLRWSHE